MWKTFFTKNTLKKNKKTIQQYKRMQKTEKNILKSRLP